VRLKHAFRALNTSADLAVFLWRRYGSPPAEVPPVPVPDAVPPARQTVDLPPDARTHDAPTTEPTRTVRFGLDGQEYEIDLSDDDAAQLRETFRRYIDAGRRIRRQSRPSTTRNRSSRASQPPAPPAERHQSAAVRAWARAAGHQVSDRGRISAKVLQAYEARQRGDGSR
jgi:hypothetical protein